MKIGFLKREGTVPSAFLIYLFLSIFLLQMPDLLRTVYMTKTLKVTPDIIYLLLSIVFWIASILLVYLYLVKETGAEKHLPGFSIKTFVFVMLAAVPLQLVYLFSRWILDNNSFINYNGGIHFNSGGIPTLLIVCLLAAIFLLLTLYSMLTVIHNGKFIKKRKIFLRSFILMFKNIKLNMIIFLVLFILTAGMTVAGRLIFYTLNILNIPVYYSLFLDMMLFSLITAIPFQMLIKWVLKAPVNEGQENSEDGKLGKAGMLIYSLLLVFGVAFLFLMSRTTPLDEAIKLINDDVTVAQRYEAEKKYDLCDAYYKRSYYSATVVSKLSRLFLQFSGRNLTTEDKNLYLTEYSNDTVVPISRSPSSTAVKLSTVLYGALNDYYGNALKP